LDNAGELLDALTLQEESHFRDLVTGDETRVHLGMKPGNVGLSDAELPVRAKKQMQVKKAC
jgi:hypothetical protein